MSTYVKDEKSKGWVEGNGAVSGVCFNISFDRLQAILKQVGSVKENETVPRVKVSNTGILVYVEKIKS